tara:strand:- start:3267 stop:3680 length:414 start_codon:yes stop_codon:yes gene_type:complete
MWERHCFKWCDENSEVVSWSSEEVVVPYLYEVDKKYHRYFVDLKITFKNKKTILVEVKPDAQTRPPKNPGKKTKRYITEGLTYVKNMNKWKAARKVAQDNGWEFQIWTENTLDSLGIRPKVKALKPLPKMKKPKKKI